MKTSSHPFPFPTSVSAAPVIAALGILALALHPAIWLVHTWADPAYDSQGALVFAVFLGLWLWSIRSPRLSANPQQQRRGVQLLVLTAAVRCLGQVLAVHVIGAMALAIDAYALGLLAGLETRRRPVSPGWAAVVFALSLPVERILQRVVGFGMQHVSAAGACVALKASFTDVQCEGLRIVLAGRDVLVDLPCAGARGLFLLLLLLAVSAAVVRPGMKRAAAGLGTTLAAALASNSLRIAALAAGLGFPERIGGIDVMAQPWHDVIGLAALMVGAAPVVGWARRAGNVNLSPASPSLAMPEPHLSAPCPLQWVSAGRGRRQLARAGLFTLIALVVVSLPQRPIDVARPMAAITLPDRLLGQPARPDPLSARERDYFVRFGGSAARASYGTHTLLMVRTTAPLRHLHAPDECLAGAGHEVRFMGAVRGGLPAAVYRSRSPEGQVYRVAVSYFSSRGERATNVAEVTWKWLRSPGTTWTAIERISPWESPLLDNEAFDDALIRAFDLPADRTSQPSISRMDRPSQLIHVAYQ